MHFVLAHAGRVSGSCSIPAWCCGRTCFACWAGSAISAATCVTAAGTISNSVCGRIIAGVRFALSRRPTVLYRQHPAQTTRSPVTGFGTDAEGWTSQEARRRGELYRRTRFDPVVFGAWASTGI